MILGTNYLKKATSVFLRVSLLYKPPIFQVASLSVSCLSLSFLICLLKLFFIDSWWLLQHASLSHSSSHPLASALYLCNPPPRKI